MLTYRQLKSEDFHLFDAGLELLNRTQGRDLFGHDYLTQRTSDLHSLVVAAFDHQALIGLGVAQVIFSCEYYLPFNPNMRSELDGAKLGSFSTLCIHENHQGKGIGQALSRLRLQWLKDNECEVILGISWVSGLKHTSNRVFEKMGFKKVNEVENFFYSSSETNPFVCPACGEPPCTCNAIMYQLDLRSSQRIG